jgi:hypothetical protein
MKILLEAIRNNVDQRTSVEVWRWLVFWLVCKEALRNSAASYAFEIVALQVNITSSVTGNEGRLKSREKTVSILSLIR